MRRAARQAALAGLPALLLGGCARVNEQQSILDPQGPRADAVHGLWQLMLVIGVTVWVLVVVAMVLALMRRRRETGEGRSPMWTVAVTGGLIPAIIIGVVTARSTVVLDRIDPGRPDDGTMVEVIGRQYWWEVHYPGQDVVTANEIHLPAGERVRLRVTSSDVIHSFWVPQLSGKIDMIPGRSNTIWVEADRPGTYWGQCAEYCGTQHALMRVVVVAHTPEEYRGWLQHQREPAPVTPGNEESAQIARGRQVFFSASCAYCHAIEGTAANAVVGPDLTHLASRQTLAAGILPNNRGNLAGWIVDPQSIKPGNRMPGADIDGEDLQALLDYLESRR